MCLYLSFYIYLQYLIVQDAWEIGHLYIISQLSKLVNAHFDLEPGKGCVSNQLFFVFQAADLLQC